MDARSLEFLHAMQRIVAVVERHTDLRRLAAESKAFDLFCNAITEFEQWEPMRIANQMEIDQHRAETDAALARLLGDLACVHAAAQLTAGHAAPLVCELPSAHHHVERVVAAAHGILNVARGHEQTLIDAGMHPRKLADVEDSAQELSQAHLRWAIAEAYAGVFAGSLVRLKTQTRKRYRQLYAELASAVTHESRADWKLAASLGRTHRPLALRSGERALPSPAEVKLLPSVTEQHAAHERRGGAAKMALAHRAIRRVMGAGSSVDKGAS
jgi:hypothetical protein